MPLIPFHDTEPSGITPRFTIALIVINILVGVAQWTDPDHLIEGALRPAWFFSYLSGEETGSVSKHELQNRDSLENVFGVPTDNPGEIRLTFANSILPLFLCMFLHGGFFHLAGNMVFLWIFGDNIEGRLGGVRYLIFYLICGLAASLFHILFNPESNIPAIGASGAISGILGAYWLCYPHSAVTVLTFFAFFPITFEIRASWLLGIYFVIDLISGLLGAEGSVAVWAHIGGFILGACVIIPLTPPGRSNPPPRFRFLDRSGLPLDDHGPDAR